MNFYTRQSNKGSPSASNPESAESAESLYRKSRRREESTYYNEWDDTDFGEEAFSGYEGHSARCCPPPHHKHCPPPPQWICCPPPQPWCPPPQPWCPPPQPWCPPPPQCCCIPGPKGDRGPRGFRGPRGKPGPANEGAIIPFSSGTTPVILTTVANALPSTGFVAAIGFGETQNNIVPGACGTQNLTATNMAFSVPRDGTITAITAYFTNTASNTVSSSVLQISVQLYRSTQPNNVFTPLEGTRVDLTPTFTGTLAANSIFTGSRENIRVRVEQGDRLVLVYFLSVVSEPTLSTTIVGNASAGVNIR